MKKNIVVLVLVCLVASAVVGTVSAKTGIGLSSPSITSITIDKFPFHYSDTLRVYNTGDEESVYSIKIDAPYPDVRDWISVDKDIFTLSPGTSTVVTFSIDAEEGYTGSYTITLTPAIVPKEKTNVTGMFVYLALGTPFAFTIDVPNGSLGERPPVPVATPTSEIPEIAKKVAESESGIMWREMGKSIFLDMPSKVYLGDLVRITASFIGGGEPVNMGLLIVSPSEKEYRLPRSTEFRFDEVGTWSVMVVIGDEVILGRPILVLQKGMGAYTPYIAIAVLAFALLVTILVLLRRKKRS